MKDDDEEDESISIGVSRYPCLPSLVALQQMRNRLHLAHLGRKLMKWTALATGREMRKIAENLIDCTAHLSEDISNAFILLARARYFYPNLNTMVLENAGKEASVKVEGQLRTLTGIKVTQFKAIDNLNDPYPHLGIDKGGQTIKEAKEAWKKLLLQTIQVAELDHSFITVEAAHKSATKKMNVLGKIIIPRTLMTLAYIQSELEEMEREEFFRLKKVLQIKLRNRKNQKVEPEITCPVCLKEQPIEKRKCIICGQYLNPLDRLPEQPQQELDSRNKLDELKLRISDILEISKDIDNRGLENFEEFLKTAEKLKDNLENEPEKQEELEPEQEPELDPIPSDTPQNQLCEVCKERFENEQMNKKQLNELKEKSSKESQHSKGSVKFAPIIEEPVGGDLCELHSQVLELGTFETEVKEIVKIIRVKNDDGTISEEKTIVKVKREVRAPIKPKPPQDNMSTSGRMMYQASDASYKSGQDKTIGIMTLDGTNTFKHTSKLRRAFSDVIVSSKPMAAVKLKSFVSSASTYTIDSEVQEEATAYTTYDGEDFLPYIEPHSCYSCHITSCKLSDSEKRICNGDRHLYINKPHSISEKYLRNINTDKCRILLSKSYH